MDLRAAEEELEEHQCWMALAEEAAAAAEQLPMMLMVEAAAAEEQLETAREAALEALAVVKIHCSAELAVAGALVAADSMLVELAQDETQREAMGEELEEFRSSGAAEAAG